MTTPKIYDANLAGLTIHRTSTIRDAMEAINRRDGGVCLVVDEEERLQGTISDGDIRRGLLKGERLDSSVGSIITPNPTVASVNASRDELLTIMQARGIRDIPLVDEGGRLVCVRTLKELLSVEPRDNWVVLMAGGTGRRLLPLTQSRPKPMLEIGGRPILETIILKLIKQGFRKFYLSVNYLSHIVKEHFEYGQRWGVEIRYLEEDQPLGTGGCLGIIADRPSQPLVVMNGDIFTNLDLGRMVDYHTRSNAMVTVAVRAHEIQVPYGVFTVSDHCVSDFSEKPVLSYSINAGIYVIEPKALMYIKPGQVLDMPDFVLDCVRRNQSVLAYRVTERWLDVGEHSEFERARRDETLHLV